MTNGNTIDQTSKTELISGMEFAAHVAKNATIYPIESMTPTTAAEAMRALIVESIKTHCIAIQPEERQQEAIVTPIRQMNSA